MMRFGEPQLNFHALSEAEKMTVGKSEYKRMIMNNSILLLILVLFYLRDNEKQRKYSL